MLSGESIISSTELGSSFHKESLNTSRDSERNLAGQRDDSSKLATQASTEPMSFQLVSSCPSAISSMFLPASGSTDGTPRRSPRTVHLPLLVRRPLPVAGTTENPRPAVDGGGNRALPTGRAAAAKIRRVFQKSGTTCSPRLCLFKLSAQGYGVRHSAEVAFALLTQLPWVRF